MHTYIIIIAILICSLPQYLCAAETNITKIRISNSSNSAQVYVSFSELPNFTKAVNGKRIDIILDASLSNSEPLQLQTDNRVVKFLTQEKENKTILTFFLRYEPQKVELSLSREKTLVLDILLGNLFTKTYPELTTKLEGLALTEEQGEDLANPYIASPYPKNWRSFFSSYEPQILPGAPIRYSRPPFPIIDLIPDVVGSDILPAEAFTLSSRAMWKDLVPLIGNVINESSEEVIQKLLALTYGEVLYRSNDYFNGFKQLTLLKDKYEVDYIGTTAAYLLALMRAEHEDPYIADVELRNLEKYLDERYQLSPFLILSQIESALATDQLERAAMLLQKDDIAFPPRLSLLKELRQADYWFATKNYVKAYVGYRLIEDKSLLDQHPYSLNGYCNSLYYQKKYDESAQCFDKLILMVTEKKQVSTISLKQAMAELHFKTAKEMYVNFSRIEDTYPDTAAGMRASLKKTDIRYLSQPSWRKTSVEYYRELAGNTLYMEVAEEAALKEAIVYAELGEKAKSIDLLLDFLRDFRAGRLKETAQALLIQILPDQLEKLLSEKRYVEAIVLAKKNRELFQKKWIEIELLGLLAKAYHELGIFNEAQKLYLYLLRTASADDEESFYLPLISILYAQGDYDLVEDFATQYGYNYPQGEYIRQINLLHLRSLIASDRNQKALKLLSSPLPESVEAKEIVATLYFTNSLYLKATESLTPYWQKKQLQSKDSLFILAESFFQQNDFDLSEQLFSELASIEKYHDQAYYRLATIAHRQGNEDMSLKFLREIVEKGNDSLWQKLAQKELKYKALDRHYQ